MAERREAVVVGAGIAGLTAGWGLRDRDVLVLEASDRVGGRIKSEPRGRYWLNFGAHVFGGTTSATGRLLEEAGVEAVTVPGVLTGIALDGRVVSSGRVETYPFRLPLSLADRLALIRLGIRLRLAVRRYGRIARPQPGEPWTVRQSRMLAYLGDHSFAEFLGRLPKNVDAIVRPTIERSSGEPEDVAAGYGVGYFHLVWNRGEGLSRNVIGGPSTFPEKLAAGLGVRLQTRSSVEEVASSGDGVQVRYVRDGEPHEVHARFAVVATPAYVTRSIVRGLPEETDRALGEIMYGPYVVAAFLTGETSAMPYDNVYAMAVAKKSFNMLFNMANVLRPDEPSREPGGSLMVYSGASLGRRLLELDDERIASLYLDDLKDIYPEAKRVVRELVIQRWERGLPYPNPGRFRLQPALERPLGNVFLAGDYLGSWYTETAVQTGSAAADAIRARLDQSGAPGSE
ncbi:MAG TPA: NAD(P)/FAD-dependent oxidoreductase [Candidatus Dormibacteraeota bacterium]|nr:NAD(P)/FAD-dependent oxidoreductase [Candidatus Dormibacteraeota bacterium]